MGAADNCLLSFVSVRVSKWKSQPDVATAEWLKVICPGNSMIRDLHARPLGITALIIFFVLGSLISFFAGLSLLIPSGFFNVMWRLNPHGHEGLLRIGFWAVILLVAACASCSIAAVGLWKRARWGRILAIVLIGINLSSDVVNTVLGIEPRAIVGVPIALLIILYLFTKRVRNYFAVSASIR